MTDRPDLAACPRCGSTDRSLMNRECVRVSTIVPRVHPWHSYGKEPSSTPDVDLAALADRLDDAPSNVAMVALTPTERAQIARILRAVATAPGPLRPPPGLYEPGAWDHWADALADAVGEP